MDIVVVLVALGSVHALFLTTGSAVHLNALDSHAAREINATPVIDSLPPPVHSDTSNDKRLATIVAIILTLVTLCIVAAIVVLLARYFMRRDAIKRRRQASWILRSGQWHAEPKRTDTHETRTGCSDTSSSFAAYPYPLSEHF